MRLIEVTRFENYGENIKHDSKDLKPLESKNSSSKDLHKKNITVKGLRKDTKLKKKAQKKMVNLGLFSESELYFSSSQSESTVNFLNIRTPKKFVVITLKFELCGSTIE